MVVCAYCGKEMEFKPITLSFSYGSPHDGEEIVLCSEPCAIAYLEQQHAQYMNGEYYGNNDADTKD